MSKLSIHSIAAAPRPGGMSGSPVAFTEAERSEVLSHLEDIVLSTAFRNSKRYCTLLRYVVERALDGEADQLKERTIGVEAFGRQADYDTNVDHSVRSAAGEVRRRLAQFYMDAGASSKVRIEILPGSYVPVIRFNGHNGAAEEIERAARDVSALEQAATPVNWGVWRWPAWLARRPAGVVIAAVCLLVTAAAFRSVWRAPSAFDQFWNPILSSPNPALLCFGGGTPDESTTTLWDLERSPIRRMNVSDALSLVAVTGTLHAKGKPYRILSRANATSFQDLRQGPFILIGAFNNEWSLRLISNLRFTFEKKGNGAYIKDRNNPSNAAWFLSGETPLSQPVRDYAIVTRLRDPLTQQSGLILAGILGWGTQAAGEFVSNPDYIRKIVAFAPSNWVQKNIQLVIATDIIRGSSGPPVLLAAHFW